MEKRIFLAVAVSIALLVVWSAVAPKLFPDLIKKPAPAAAQKTAAPASPNPAAAPSASTTTAAAGSAAPTAPDARSVEPVAAQSVQETVIDTPSFVARFSNRGAQLVSFRLKGYTTADHQPVELVKAREPQRSDFPFAIEAKDGKLAERLNRALYAVSERNEPGLRVLEYRFAGDGVTAVKTFRIGNDYQFAFSMTVDPPVPYRVMIGPGIRTLAGDEKDSQFIITGNGVVQREGKLTVVRREKADAVSSYPGAQFVGIEDNYFLAVLRPAKEGEGVIRRIEIRQEQNS
jgi:YidC/Oxa1 family membrane protein insertase